MLIPLDVSSDRNFSQKKTSQHGAKISHVHRHHGQHTVILVSGNPLAS